METKQNKLSKRVLKSTHKKLKYSLNERKYKEFRISFGRNEPEFDPVYVTRQTLQTVKSVKLWGLSIIKAVI